MVKYKADLSLYIKPHRRGMSGEASQDQALADDIFLLVLLVGIGKAGGAKKKGAL
jgi:hypothetical protein